jgi:hypothetical protein
MTTSLRLRRHFLHLIPEHPIAEKIDNVVLRVVLQFDALPELK